MADDIRIFGVVGMPEVKPGDDLADLITAALARQGERLLAGDVVVVTQKVVSKAEGQVVDLAGVVPSTLASNFAAQTGKDAREVEVVLGEAARIVRMSGGTLIVETRHGFICANAGVDHSNMDPGRLCLLPVDPDRSARTIREGLRRGTGTAVAVIISDTFGRAWRMGQTNVAIGVAGMLAITDYRGQTDAAGRELKVTALAVADELAAASELVMNKLDGVPVAVIRGYTVPAGDGTARDMVRPADKDLFR